MVAMSQRQLPHTRAAALLLLIPAFILAVIAHAQSHPNPILPGDHPDPSIIRVGNTYWTTSTSGNRTPVFPLFHSTDLTHWTAAGFIFNQRPAWAGNSMWAPELVSDGGRYFVYYAGRKKNGPLCVAVATAKQPSGPWQDHGPIVCQPDGSIDAAFTRDEHGAPYLIWKEDGNSQHKPTPIWAQPLTADLLHLRGEKRELIVNDAAWEGGVVEGPFVLRHAGHFYLFYAGNACCGATCNYAEGVARADSLLGPWQKDPANPIIRANQHWKCPGHGSIVHSVDGRDVLVYHAYPATGPVSGGRESLRDTITWGPNGWPTVNGGHGPSGGR
jgi:xylan 1,4-beta-xylosidase